MTTQGESEFMKNIADVIASANAPQPHMYEITHRNGCLSLRHYDEYVFCESTRFMSVNGVGIGKRLPRGTKTFDSFDKLYFYLLKYNAPELTQCVIDLI